MLEIARPLLGDEHWATVAVLGNLGDLYTSQGRYARAEPLLAEGLALARRMNMRNARLGGMVVRLYGRWLTEQGRYDEAEAALLEAHEIVFAPEGLEDRVGTGIMVIERLVELYEAWGKPEKASEWRGRLMDADPNSSRTQ